MIGCKVVGIGEWRIVVFARLLGLYVHGFQPYTTCANNVIVYVITDVIGVILLYSKACKSDLKYSFQRLFYPIFGGENDSVEKFVKPHSPVSPCV